MPEQNLVRFFRLKLRQVPFYFGPYLFLHLRKMLDHKRVPNPRKADCSISSPPHPFQLQREPSGFHKFCPSYPNTSPSIFTYKAALAHIQASPWKLGGNGRASFIKCMGCYRIGLANLFGISRRHDKRISIDDPQHTI